jgi:hypothetical protein
VCGVVEGKRKGAEMRWLNHKSASRVEHCFHEKPYTPGLLKAVCGYTTYVDKLVGYGWKKTCKKCEKIMMRFYR